MTIKSISTKIALISMLENGIIKVHGHSNVHITVEFMIENDQAFEQLLQGREALFLTILGENATIDRDAENYFSDKDRTKMIIAEALLTSQTHHKLIILKHIVHSKPDYAIKAFKIDQEREAIQWLLERKTDNLF
ncbi:MAG: hypothetical protein HYZ14_08725 [Bacteroidetes bacterium]|nr:hypothetical protein [Bacteroidota bacterium]